MVARSCRPRGGCLWRDCPPLEFGCCHAGRDHVRCLGEGANAWLHECDLSRESVIAAAMGEVASTLAGHRWRSGGERASGTPPGQANCDCTGSHVGLRSRCDARTSGVALPVGGPELETDASGNPIAFPGVMVEP